MHIKYKDVIEFLKKLISCITLEEEKKENKEDEYALHNKNVYYLNELDIKNVRYNYITQLPEYDESELIGIEF
jgi:hypothetical protein